MKTYFNILTRSAFLVVALLASLTSVQTSHAQTWAMNSPLKAARWSHTATLLTNGFVLLAGGIIYNTNSLFADTNACELYNPGTGTSALTSPMQDSRYSFTATRLTNGQVLVTGGGGDATSEVYDPPSGNWINLVSMSNERIAHTATLLPGGQVLVAAGFDDNNGGELASAEIYNVGSQTWTNTGPMPYATDSAAAVLLTNGMVLVCGGSDGNGGSVTNAALYNPVTHAWASTLGMNQTRAGHAATLLPDGTVLVIGGGDNSAEIYDPVALTWTYVASMQDGRQYPQAVLLNDGKVMVLGGDPFNTNVELYDRRNDQWFNTASLLVPGNSQTATLLPGGQVVVTGGDATYYNGPPLATVQTFTANLATGHTLIAHYAFDASSLGDPFNSQFLSDTSGHGYHISNPDTFDGTNPPATTTRIAGVSAVQFDGNNFYNLPKVLLTTVAGTYSLSLWLKTTQVSGSDTDQGYSAPAIVWGGGVGADYFDSEPMTLTGHKLGFFTGDDGATLHSATSINSGSFIHIVVSRDQRTGVKKIYINGVLDATATGGTNYLSHSADLILGLSYYQNGVAGIVDDVQFYNGLLTAGEVANLHTTPGSTAPDSAGSTSIPSLTVTATPQSGAPSLNVHFTSPSVDSGGNTVTNWNWTFGDGGTSTAQSPSHTYSSVGLYAPSLAAYSTFGSSPLNVTGPGTITVAVPTLNASVSPQIGQAPLTVQFTTPSQDSAGFTVTNWNWTFGDGGTSTAQNPSHTYINPGIFSPSLMARSTYSSSPVTITYGFTTITVTNPPNPFFHVLHSFTATSGSSSTNGDGTVPNRSLVLSGNTLYGTAQHGGVNGVGTLFSLRTDGSGFADLYNFSFASGATPVDGVTLAGNTFFGVTYLGGTRSGGTIFAMNTNGTSYTNLFNYNFNVDPNSGGSPQAGVVLADKTLYGTTWFGGAFNHGTITYVTTNGVSSGIFHHFSNPSGPDANLNYDGLFPSSKLIYSNGTLYGTAEGGGSFASGTVFAVDTNNPGSFRILHYFSATTPQYTGTNTDGAFPFAGLVLSGNTLYGTTFAGGNSGYGTVFAVNTNGSGFTNLHSFTGTNDGYGPHSGLTLSGNTLYGTTSGGGNSGTLSNGTLFSINTDGSGFRNLYGFSGGSDGAAPQGQLVLSGNTLYGTTASGGDAGNGTVFSFALTPPIILTNPTLFAGGAFQFTFLSQSGSMHNVQYRTNLIAGLTWQTYSNVTGDGTLKTIPIPRSVFSPSQQGFVRILTQ